MILTSWPSFAGNALSSAVQVAQPSQRIVQCLWSETVGVKPVRLLSAVMNDPSSPTAGRPRVANRQLVILSRQDATPDRRAPLGPREKVLRELAEHNTSPEGAGDDVLYGPGIQIELPPGEDPITQMLVTVTEEEIGWLVVTRLASVFQWKILDPDTGRELSP